MLTSLAGEFLSCIWLSVKIKLFGDEGLGRGRYLGVNGAKMMILKVVKELGSWQVSLTLRSRVSGLLEVSAVQLSITDTC